MGPKTRNPKTNRGHRRTQLGNPLAQLGTATLLPLRPHHLPLGEMETLVPGRCGRESTRAHVGGRRLSQPVRMGGEFEEGAASGSRPRRFGVEGVFDEEVDHASTQAG